MEVFVVNWPVKTRRQGDFYKSPVIIDLQLHKTVNNNVVRYLIACVFYSDKCI